MNPSSTRTKEGWKKKTVDPVTAQRLRRCELTPSLRCSPVLGRKCSEFEWFSPRAGLTAVFALEGSGYIARLGLAVPLWGKNYLELELDLELCAAPELTGTGARHCNTIFPQRGRARIKNTHHKPYKVPGTGIPIVRSVRGCTDRSGIRANHFRTGVPLELRDKILTSRFLSGWSKKRDCGSEVGFHAQPVLNKIRATR